MYFNCGLQNSDSTIEDILTRAEGRGEILIFIRCCMPAWLAINPGHQCWYC